MSDIGPTYGDFRKMTGKRHLSVYDKISAPAEAREGFEQKILDCIVSRFRRIQKQPRIVLDLGCGCTPLVRLIRDYSAKNNIHLLLLDSPEMLRICGAAPGPGVEFFAGRFPNSPKLTKRYENKIDFIILYDVLQHAAMDADLFGFLDAAVHLLAPGGGLLIGNFPNASKNARFLGGIHENEKVEPMKLFPDFFDDKTAQAIQTRYREKGFEVSILAQPEDLAFSNSRDDILMVKAG